MCVSAQASQSLVHHSSRLNVMITALSLIGPAFLLPASFSVLRTANKGKKNRIADYCIPAGSGTQSSQIKEGEGENISDYDNELDPIPDEEEDKLPDWSETDKKPLNFMVRLKLARNDMPAILSLDDNYEDFLETNNLIDVNF